MKRKRKSTLNKKLKKMGNKVSTKAARGTKDQLNFHLAKDIWPIEKDVLFRPDRLKYVRKLIPKDNCVFCAAAQGQMDLESLCVFQTRHSMIVLNKFPYNSGHLLVLPRRHCGSLLKLTKQEFGDLQEVVRLAMQAIEEIYAPGGINLGLNHGAVAGAGIPDHTHYHLIPRWTGDLNFFPLIADTKVVIESLEQTFQKYFQYFQNIGKSNEQI